MARIGGEEFVVVLPGADVRAAAGIADNIRQRVIKLGIPHAPSPDRKYVTVSAAIAAADEAKATDANTILAGADAALCRAKSGGRDRVEPAWRSLPGGRTPDGVDEVRRFSLHPGVAVREPNARAWLEELRNAVAQFWHL